MIAVVMINRSLIISTKIYILLLFAICLSVSFEKSVESSDNNWQTIHSPSVASIFG